MAADKTTETRLRRAVARRGLELQKSKRRDPKAFDFGRFQLFDPVSQTVITGNVPHPFSMTLQDLEAWLSK